MSVPTVTVALMTQTPRLSLPRVADRVGVLTFEHAHLTKRDHIVVAQTKNGDLEIPTATLTAILAGPGTSITHDAAALLADNGVTVCWTGSGAIRAYATITPLAIQANLLHTQVQRWADHDLRLASAAIAYHRRFTDADTAETASFTALRTAEGRRVKNLYRHYSSVYGIPWTGRKAQWAHGDPLNQAITATYHCFYGAAANVIAALGCHHALGFIHTGKQDAFVYDIADIHKINTGLPLAFRIAADGGSECDVRTEVNVELRRSRILATMVEDLYAILGLTKPDIDLLYTDDLYLYDPERLQPARTNYDTADF